MIQPDPNTVIISNFFCLYLAQPGPSTPNRFRLGIHASCKTLDALGCLLIHPIFSNMIPSSLGLKDFPMSQLIFHIWSDTELGKLILGAHHETVLSD